MVSSEKKKGRRRKERKIEPPMIKGQTISTQTLQKSLSNQPFDVTLADIELAIFGEVDGTVRKRERQ
jgi:hypothetical protein